mmetsp:Transcript_5669/g.20623  ORF Transcript_5669/g.20623 Transcript_5669/m.20623 type:complete len:604 (-) Transcript_5669:267-2078(-)
MTMLTRIAGLAALGGFLYGYDLGLIGGALHGIEREFDTSEEQEELIVAGTKFGAVPGAFLGAVLMLAYGRRLCIALDSIPYVVGPVLMALATEWWLLVLGRVIVGMGVGISAIVVPAYLGEMSPARSRGTIVSIYEVMLGLGMVFAQLIDWALGSPASEEDDELFSADEGAEAMSASMPVPASDGELDEDPGNWRWMVGIPAIPGVLLVLALVLLTESPRWLIMQNRMADALRAIHRLRDNKGSVVDDSSTAEVEEELLMIWDSVEKVKAESAEARKAAATGRESSKQKSEKAAAINASHDTNGGGIPVPSSESNGNGKHSNQMSGEADTARSDALAIEQVEVADTFWKASKEMGRDFVELARGGNQRALKLAMGLAFFNQATASTAIINFSVKVLEDTGVSENNSVLLSVPITSCKIVGIFVSLCLVDTLGRRPLLMLGSAGQTIGMLLLAAGYASGSSAFTLTAICIYIFAFASSWAGGFWVILSEIFTMRLKSPAAALSTALLFAVGAVTNIFFLSMLRSLNEWTFVIFAGIAFGSLIFVYLFLPETKGKTLEEVQDLFKSDRWREKASYETSWSSVLCFWRRKKTLALAYVCLNTGASL